MRGEVTGADEMRFCLVRVAVPGEPARKGELGARELMSLVRQLLPRPHLFVGHRRVTVRVLGGPLQVRISDDGCGIPPEHAARIFEARFTTKPPGRGTGLGLHIARQAMQRNGGDVHLVPPADAQRLPWAVTEFAIEMVEG